MSGYGDGFYGSGFYGNPIPNSRSVELSMKTAGLTQINAASDLRMELSVTSPDMRLGAGRVGVLKVVVSSEAI